MAKQEKITTEKLAVMIKRGFDETAKKADMEAGFAEMKADIVRLEREIAELREDIAHIKRLPESVARRVDRLEDDMRLVKTKVGI